MNKEAPRSCPKLPIENSIYGETHQILAEYKDKPFGTSPFLDIPFNWEKMRKKAMTRFILTFALNKIVDRYNKAKASFKKGH